MRIDVYGVERRTDSDSRSNVVRPLVRKWTLRSFLSAMCASRRTVIETIR